MTEIDGKMENRRAYQVGVAVGKASRQAEIDALLARAEKAEAQLKVIEDWGTEDINAAVDLRQKLAQTLVELNAAEAERDTAWDDAIEAEAERDTAWNDAIEAAAKYHHNFLITKTWSDVEKVIASTTAIRALKKRDTP